MKTPSGLLPGIVLAMRCHGDSIYTKDLKRLAALASYVLFAIKFFAIHQNMEPSQWGNTLLQKLASQS
jgi:hypothetical protein